LQISKPDVHIIKTLIFDEIVRILAVAPVDGASTGPLDSRHAILPRYMTYSILSVRISLIL